MIQHASIPKPILNNCKTLLELLPLTSTGIHLAPSRFELLSAEQIKTGLNIQDVKENRMDLTISAEIDGIGQLAIIAD